MPESKPALSRSIHTIQLAFQGASREFHLSPTEQGLAVAQEVFSGSAYPIIPFQGAVETILDIGANIGAASVYFSLHYPQSRVLAFEPDPTSFELLKKNIKGLTNITSFNFGLSDQSTTQPLYHGREDSATNSLHQSPWNTAESSLVELRAADAVLREQGIDQIDILKVDTEGSELSILTALSDWLPKTGCLYLEYHHADDRIGIERLLADSHWLCWGKIISPHRGEFAYISRARIPKIGKWEQDKIERR